MADDYRFPVDATAILQFASALGETNPIYWDEAYAARTPLGGVIAPPSFPIAAAHWNPNHPLRGIRQIPPPAPRHERPASAGGAKAAGSGSGLARGLHGEQRFEYHKPLRPGMTLTVSTRPGRAWVKEGRRGGTLRFSESISEYRDADGELVVTAISVGIVTSRAVEG